VGDCARKTRVTEKLAYLVGTLLCKICISKGVAVLTVKKGGYCLCSEQGALRRYLEAQAAQDGQQPSSVVLGVAGS